MTTETMTLTMTDGTSVTGTPAELATLLTLLPEPEAKASPKPKTAPKVRYVTKRSLGDFNKATGRNFRKQTTAAKALYEGKVKAEGWAVGPATKFYFDNGRWPEKGELS